MQKDFETWIKRFKLDPLELNGSQFQLNRDELTELHHYNTPPYRLTNNYWHPDGPSTWLGISVFTLIRRKYPKLSEKDQLIMSAHFLNVEFKEMLRLIQWHEGYMTFHDGGEYKLLEGEYE